jgi:hypothetical protein
MLQSHPDGRVYVAARADQGKPEAAAKIEELLLAGFRTAAPHGSQKTPARHWGAAPLAEFEGYAIGQIEQDVVAAGD